MDQTCVPHARDWFGPVTEDALDTHAMWGMHKYITMRKQTLTSLQWSVSPAALQAAASSCRSADPPRSGPVSL
jgi:hypothetical protein